MNTFGEIFVIGESGFTVLFSLLLSRCENFHNIFLIVLLQMQIFFYNPDDFDSFQTAISENRIIGAMAIFFQVS